tara:strand:+ start:760 stop:1017 length:258 start_codon:yes stop_codon:yes gene_type:complete
MSKIKSLSHKRCVVTGKGVMFGNNVSHSNKKTRRRFNANIHKKKFWVAEEKRWVTLKVSARGIRTIAKKGISKILSELRNTGVKV